MSIQFNKTKFLSKNKILSKEIKIGILIFFIFFIFVFYVYYLYKIPNPPDKSGLLKYYSKEIVLKTGGELVYPKDRIQHFLQFSSSKRKDTVRIGTFGDSYTYGSDIDQKASYPHQLQKMFDRYLPDKKVEILNFGMPGSGFQGQFFLWEKYAEEYKLD